MIEPLSSQTNSKTDSASAVVPWERVEKFVGQVSHDLRNGLNACELQLTFLAEIVESPDAADEIKQLRQTLAGITKQLQTLRVATTAASVHPMAYSAADLFEDLRERFNRLQPNAERRLTWECSVQGQKTISIDPDLTIFACLELLANALHFAVPNSVVLCALREDASGIFCLVDQAAAEPPSIPTEVWGNDPLVTTRRGSYGLGLFRARRTLRAQGCELSFQYSSATERLAARISLPAASV